MKASQLFRPPRYLLMAFLSIMLVLAATLGWLSWRFLEQDRALQSQRIQERVENAADLIVTALLRELTETEEHLGSLAAAADGPLPPNTSRLGEMRSEDILVAALRSQTVEAFPSARLLYYPILTAPKEAPTTMFASGEAFEFQQRDYLRAITSFRELARSPEPAIRAGALLRLGRSLRKTAQHVAALAVYQELARLDSTSVGGVPAELLARYARCLIFDELKRLPDLQQEASALHADLYSARWQLTRDSFHFYTQETHRWINPDSSARVHEQNALAVAASVELLWDEWQRIRRGEGSPSGRRSLWVYDRPVLLLWRSSPQRLVALIAGPRYLEQQWLPALQPVLNRLGVQLALTDAEGHSILSQLGPTVSQQALRIPGETQLPWTLHVASADPQADLAQLAGRRRLLLAGFALTAALVLVASYFITRAVKRELEVAQLQSDFVSAVSHEFRTPLASLRQLSELLADGRVSSEERRQEYYEGLRRESERLHRLVENLLDFGRMEAGAREYRFEVLDPGELIRTVAQEFAQEVADRGYRIEITANAQLPSVRADNEALSRALWNLLDNAVKYSPNVKTVWIEAGCGDGGVLIRVRDQGLGIAPGEQEKIFRKFVRAASAEATGIKGTGLGLAMVKHIVVAHGGEVHLSSEPGAGSTFTILLPVAKE